MAAHTTVLPDEIRQAFFGDVKVSVRPLNGGMINANFKVTPVKEKPVVVQRISSIFDAKPLAQDIAAVTDHLRAQGWEVPVFLPGVNGELLQFDNTEDHRPWRAMTYIASDGLPQIDAEDSNDALRHCGALLANWHVTMRSLDYTPQHHLLHFHDTAYHLSHLKRSVGNMPDQVSSDLSREVISHVKSMPTLPNLGHQLLHGDPRTANMLFHKNEAFTLIDFDTIMKGQIWIDLGDLLRSLAEDANDAGTPLPIETIKAVAETYRAGAYPKTSPDQFAEWAIAAMKLIAAELTARFLNDYAADEKYFAELTQEQRLERAQAQWRIVTQTEEKK